MKKLLPNLLTLSRFPLGLYCGALILNGERFFTAAIVFVLTQISDSFDGALARRWGTTSKFGRMADHLADKFVLLIMLTLFLVYGLVPPALFYVIWTRESLLTSLRHLAKSRGHAGFLKTSKWGRRLSLLFITSFCALTVLIGVQLSSSGAAWWPLVWKTVLALTWMGVAIKVGFFVRYLWRDREAALAMLGWPKSAAPPR